jgi:hypothetical protein
VNTKLENANGYPCNVSLNAMYGPIIPYMLSVTVHDAGMNELKDIVNLKLILPKQCLESKLQSD